MDKSHSLTCQVCKQFKEGLIRGELISNPMTKFIKSKMYEWDETGFICHADLNKFRIQYIEDTIVKDKGALTKIEKDIVNSFNEQELISKNLFKEFDSRRTIGNRLADKVAIFGGSWFFIIVFPMVIAIWITVNSISLSKRPFDPYPFILLNLILSCIAALQAPVIMMSQSRIEARDRLRAELDYQINTKAEIEIKNLHEKIDHLVMTQWQRLLEIQQFQIELMQELLERTKAGT